MTASPRSGSRALIDAYDNLRQTLRQNRVKGVADIPPEFLQGKHTHDGIMPIALIHVAQLASYPNAFDAIANPDRVCSAVERFVDRLCERPDWKAEFIGRVEYVTSQCRAGRVYDRSKNNLIAAVQVNLSPSEAQEGLKRLRKHDPPGTVADLWDEEMLTKRLLDGDQFLGTIDATARPALEKWHNECRRIAREANRLDARGCWKMHQIYLAAGPESSDPPDSLRALLEAREFQQAVQDCGLLTDVESAATALMDFVEASDTKSDTGKNFQKSVR